jgi:hypothetical protein
MTEMIWEPESEPEGADGAVYPLPRTAASCDVGVIERESAYGVWVRNGGDPRLYPFTPEEYAHLEHWWIADMASLPTADVESELEHVTGRLVALQLNPDVAQGLIDGVMYQPILEQRAAWLAWEIKRRNALPDPPRAGFKLPSDFVRRLKDACNLPEFLVGELGFSLKRQGRDHVGLCPYHTEKTPSFVVHESNFYCFGCQQSGDVFDLLIVSGTCRTWRQAVEQVARYVGVAMPQPPPKAPEPRQTVPPATRLGPPEPIWSKYSA